jgi:2-keto-4-pentenoate hydratase/2-oxohepta-3-ene-1,7-dioic acid hydratase in catechol pathway
MSPGSSERRRSSRAALAALGAILAAAPAAAGALPPRSPLDACLAERALPRVARAIDPSGQLVYARVLEERDGQPTRLATIAPAATPLAEVFDRAPDPGASPFEIPVADRAARICAPVDLPQADLDAGRRVIVAAGLNYAAHAEESGGGEVFVFPKPAEPTGPYRPLHPPAGVVLLDYEVELGFVLLEEIDPRRPPSGDALLAASAFFLANDVSDREPIVRYKALSGPGTGFVDGKGQPGFLPAGPWLVRGSDYFAALAACGADGFGLELWVDGGAGLEPRQSATTAAMILPPHELLARIGDEVERAGPLSPMPLRRDGAERFYPLAIGEPALRLPAGSLVLTGTPEGVAIGQADPSPVGLILRGLLHLRGPFAQFVAEEKQRVAAGARGGYLKAGDRVVARIDGLGTQEFSIGPAGALPAVDPCRRAGVDAATANASGGTP